MTLLESSMISVQFRDCNASAPLPMAAKPIPRRVDWPVILNAKVGIFRASPPRTGAVSVLAAADELSTYRDLDLMLRRAVEITRDRIGFERVALFLYDDSGEMLRGTWGTGLAGETSRQRHRRPAPRSRNIALAPTFGRTSPRGG